MLRTAISALAVAALALPGCGGGGDEPPKPADGRSAGTPAKPRPRPPKSKRQVPVLMYHLVGAAPASAPYPDLYVKPRDFRGQVAWLARHGYTAVTLDDVEDAWHGLRRLPRRPVVLTFDDGYRDVYDNALPELRRRHWPGVLFLIVDNLQIRAGLPPPMVRSLLRSGWELGSHTITHADLTTLDPKTLRREVAGSRRMLSAKFGVPVRNFCYPSGRYNPNVIAAVRRAGYRGATTTMPGLASRRQPFELRRIRVNGSGGVGGLAAAMAGTGA